MNKATTSIDKEIIESIGDNGDNVKDSTSAAAQAH